MRLFKKVRSVWHKVSQVGLRRLLRDCARLRIVEKSPLFDADWYRQNNPDCAESGMNPALHYLLHSAIRPRNPSPYFSNEEYLSLHGDVRASGRNPLVHYELHGRREGRPVSFLEVSAPVFPDGCIEGTFHFSCKPSICGRTAIVASYLPQGAPSPALLYLLRGLGEVVDNIVYVADNPVLPAEVEKFRGLVAVAHFERHGQYDFGSYKRGLELARREGLLPPDGSHGKADPSGELVVMNDSNYGPVHPFAESFARMAARPCDFWGYTGYNAFGNVHISSYFYCFRRPVVESGVLDSFLREIKGPLERDKAILAQEFRLTRVLADAGFRWETLVPLGAVGKGAPTKYPLTLCGKYRVPLLKVKAVNGDSYESVEKTLALVADANPELRALITPTPIVRTPPRVSYAQHQAAFPAKVAKIGAKLRRGEKIKAVFLVSNAAMFPARPLFEAMAEDAAFAAAVVVIPDLRWHDGGVEAAMKECCQKLSKMIQNARIDVAQQDAFGNWCEVLADADIVCYPSPYEFSSFRYNPRYAVGRDFLPICVNYGYYRSIYDRALMRLQHYAYLWKAFFECKATLLEYTANSPIGGTNADLTGYVKMDSLARFLPPSHPPPPFNQTTKQSKNQKILVALHHSVEGGTNKALSLANFVRYADFFLELPDRHPRITFIFRPHPFLLKVLRQPGQWGPARTERYVAELKAKPNVVWSDGGDYFRDFATSDACIQDCGSYLVEYFYTKKPCCYLLKSPDDISRKFAPLGVECLENCYLAYDEAAIERFIQEVVVAGRDPMKARREAFAETVMVNYPHAARTALDHIKSALLRQ